jgi:hypothetical protein
MKHGHTKIKRTPTYNSWRAMKQRCLNKNHDKYYNYGALGVKVCKSWLKFENFLKDVGARPKGKTLDRINPNGDYEYNNCRWASNKTQARNKKKVRYFKNMIEVWYEAA